MLQRLNQGYASTGFSFRYVNSTQTANGVNGAVSKCTQSNNEAFLTKMRVGGPDVLNIVVCDTTLGGTQPYELGFATTPPGVIVGGLAVDGIGIAHPDAQGLVDTQETLIHEVGHWLGLLHTFQSNTVRELSWQYIREVKSPACMDLCLTQLVVPRSRLSARQWLRQ
jgi:hypothetical protein